MSFSGFGLTGGAASGFGAAAAFGTVQGGKTSAFGAPLSAFGSVPSVMSSAPQVGTGKPPYQVAHEVDPLSTDTGNYFSITKMAAYAHKSTEELRYEDYLKWTDPTAANVAAALNPPSAGVSDVTGAGAFWTTPSAFGAQPAFDSSAVATPFVAKPAVNASPFRFANVFGGAANLPTAAALGGGNAGSVGGFGAPLQPAVAPLIGGATFGAAPAAFGAPQGGKSSAFGAPAASVFNATPFAFVAAPSAMGSAPPVGTGNPPYQVTHEVDSLSPNVGNYFSITKMAAYAHKSPEELRYEDYLKWTDPTAAHVAAALNHRSTACFIRI